MFPAIDNLIISYFQWGVRQIELYTTKTRKDILSFILFLMKIDLILMFIFLIVFTPSFIFVDWWYTRIIRSFNFLMSVLTLALFRAYYIKSVEVAKKETKEGYLPQEIVTRRSFRWFFCLTCSVLSVLLSMYIVFFDKFDIATISIIALLVLMFICLFFEYLLCTLGLPKGEKEKFKREREMRKAVPNPV